MNNIIHIIEPNRILLAWKSMLVSPRQSFVVGSLIRTSADPESVRLDYHLNTDDFQAAIKKGFEGYPAFPIQAGKSFEGVLESFLMRLPPRTRTDFDKYLSDLRIPLEAGRKMSDLALLAYSEGKLPGDGFFFAHPFDEIRGPCEILIEIAGFRHHSSISTNAIGDKIFFIPEPENKWDPKAIKIVAGPIKIGYVSHIQLPTFHYWLAHSKIEGAIERFNGTTDAPRAFAFVRVTPKT